MKKKYLFFFALLISFVQISLAQIPTNTLVQIVKTEDARRWDSTLETLLKNSDAKIRIRAALAAGRIGDEKAVSALINLLKDSSAEVQTMAMFALGEIESAKASDAVLEVLKNQTLPDSLRARAIEAAGKIAAANPKDAKNSEIGSAIVSALNSELGKNSPTSYEIILLGETAVLRARPEGGEDLMIKLLSQPNARIRVDALNTLARLRSKKANNQSRELLQKDVDPIVRANAARMLGVGEDKSAIDLLLNAATKDEDSRVRVSAIRSLGTLKDENSINKVLDGLVGNISVLSAASAVCKAANAAANAAKAVLPASKREAAATKNYNESCYDTKSEKLEIAATLGRLLAGTNNQKAIDFLVKFNESDKYQSPETEIALAKIAPSKFSEIQRNKKDSLKNNWQAINSMMAGIGELAKVKDSSETESVKTFARAQALAYIRGQLLTNQAEDKTLSDALQAYASFKSADLPEVLHDSMQHNDPVVRATVAGLLAETTPSKETSEVLKKAFIKSLLTDKRENDAQLAILNSLYKLDKKESLSSLLLALNAPDYLVRQKAFQLIKEGDFAKDSPGIPAMLENKKMTVEPYAAYTGTKLGQVLNTQADYVRAVSRKNGTVKAVLTTTKGNFTIEFFPEDAPLTVDNFIKLARSNYFNGVLVHRVVPNFVMQDGDPRGDGNGGPGWSIRCEINMIPFERGLIGMALSGKDTGGSQWFATHSPQPHLDGGYTVFGRVNENDMKVVDNIVRGDKILSVKIIEKVLPNKKR